MRQQCSCGAYSDLFTRRQLTRILKRWAIASVLSPTHDSIWMNTNHLFQFVQSKMYNSKKKTTKETLHKCFRFNAKDICIENSDKRFKDHFPQLWLSGRIVMKKLNFYVFLPMKNETLCNKKGLIIMKQISGVKIFIAIFNYGIFFKMWIGNDGLLIIFENITKPWPRINHVYGGGSRISQRGCANLLFGKGFAENCIKMKETEQGGPSVPLSLDAPLAQYARSVINGGGLFSYLGPVRESMFSCYVHNVTVREWRW